MLSQIPNWAAILISVGGALIIAAIIQLFVKPCIINSISGLNWSINSVKLDNLDNDTLTSDSSLENEIKQVVGRRHGMKFLKKKTKFVIVRLGLIRFFQWLIPKSNRFENVRTMKLFTVMQMFTAGFSGFANGASDMR